MYSSKRRFRAMAFLYYIFDTSHVDLPPQDGDGGVQQQPFSVALEMKLRFEVGLKFLNTS